MTRIALVQQRVGADKGANVARGVKALEAAAAKGAEVVCFSELAFEPFYPQCKAQAEYEHLAEPVPGPTTDIFVALARLLGVVVVLNLFERDGERCFDTSPVIDADGTLLGVTRMVHITDYPNFHEQDYYTGWGRPGAAPQGEEHILVVDIDLNSAGRSHARRLFLQHRRPELYVKWFGPEERPGDATL